MPRLGFAGAIVQAAVNNLPQHGFVLAQVVASGGLDVLVAGQVLDVGDVGAVVE